MKLKVGAKYGAVLRLSAQQCVANKNILNAHGAKLLKQVDNDVVVEIHDDNDEHQKQQEPKTEP